MFIFKEGKESNGNIVEDDKILIFYQCIAMPETGGKKGSQAKDSTSFSSAPQWH
ncbi:MAG: hypothetical protein ABIR30_01200 [Chitinophagaceae bacterium]